MSVSRTSLPFAAACLGAITASPAPAQGTTGTPRPDAALLAATVDSVVQVDVLAQGMPSVSIVVARGNETLLERAGASKFVGEYEAVPGIVFAVTLENGILFNTPPARLGSPKQHLVHRSGTSFAQGGNESVTPTFLVDAGGEVTAFVARSGGTERTPRKVK